MKSLQEFINEGLFSKKIKGTNFPIEMPDKYKNFFTNYFEDIKHDVKTEKDVEDYIRFACDDFWDMLISDYKWNPYKNKDTYDAIWPAWKDEIIKIALKK